MLDTFIAETNTDSFDAIMLDQAPLQNAILAIFLLINPLKNMDSMVQIKLSPFSVD